MKTKAKENQTVINLAIVTKVQANCGGKKGGCYITVMPYFQKKAA